MCAEELDVALIVPNIDAYSGAVERTVKVVEHSRTVGLNYTAFLPAGGAPNAELARDLERLEREGRLVRRTLRPEDAADGKPSFDAVAIPTEYWWGAWKRAKAAGIRGPYCVDFHLLPYVGTLDLLKSAGVDDPRLPDLTRLPFLLRRTYMEGLVASTYQTVACVASVRSLARVRGGRVLAISRSVERNLRSLAYGAAVYVPDRPNGIEPGAVREALRTTEPIRYDGIYVARFHPQKGLYDLPLLVANLRRRLGREVTVAVCGGTADEAHWARVREVAASLGVERNLKLLGRVPKTHLYRAMRQSKALLYPSYVDGFPITVLESLCLGVPVVGYDTDALAMTWGQERAVFRAPVGDPEALARLYAELEGDAGLEAARAEAESRSPRLLETYTWEHVVQDQRAFFEGTVGEA